MITNEKAFESALRELRSYDAAKEVSDLKLQDPLSAAQIGSKITSEESMTRIAKGTIVTGDLKSDEAIFVEGRIDGNIIADSDVGINGLVNGDINARNIHFQTAGVKGNTVAKQSATLDRKAVIVGDITAENMTVDGKIKGTATATEKMVLERNALISGAIIAGGISINDGAKISASITITNADVIDDSNFEI